MLPPFHVDGDLHDILHPALYPGKSRRPRRVKGVRGVQFEACIGFDATFRESVIVGDDDYLVRGVAKAQFAELLSGDILREYGLGKAPCKCGCQPKKRNSIRVLTWFLLSRSRALLCLHPSIVRSELWVLPTANYRI
jgi:hypothetical protein